MKMEVILPPGTNHPENAAKLYGKSEESLRITNTYNLPSHRALKIIKLVSSKNIKYSYLDK